MRSSRIARRRARGSDAYPVVTSPSVVEGDGPRTDAEALGHDNRLEVAHRLSQPTAVVNDHIVVFAHPLHLALGGLHANVALFGRLGAAGFETRGELFKRRRPQE